jgi:sugar transferase (PEP-CTERM system associated)
VIRIFSRYVSLRGLLLAVGECGFILFGLFCGVRLRFWNDPEEFRHYVQAPGFVLQGLVYTVTLLVCFYYSDLYDLRAIRQRRDQMIGLTQSLGTASLLLGVLYFVFPGLLIGRGVFFISTAVVAVLVVSMRVLLEKAWQMASPTQSVLILGTQRLGLTVATELERRSDLNLVVAGFLEAAPSERPVGPGRGGVAVSEPAQATSIVPARRILGRLDDLERVVRAHQIGRIIVALEDRRGKLPIRDLVRLRVEGVLVEDAATTVASLTGRIWLELVHPSWLVFGGGFHRARLGLALKRAVDLAASLVGLALSAPLMLLAALAVRLDSPGPVIFRQTRVGYRGRTFDVLKFRSMRLDAEADTGAQWAKVNDSRVTRVGQYLRKYRLDELPQFINVIRGDMSFVGPRPERPFFVNQLREAIAFYDERHSVRPGLTGWAQVEYSYGASVEDALRKLEYDLFYLKNMSALFDLLVIVKTVRLVLGGKGSR